MKTVISLHEFDKTFKKGDINIIAGIDEAGRGPLAGPVTVAAVIMPLDDNLIIKGVNDSKKLTPKKRETLFEKIINTATAHHIEFISEDIIDEINILNATKLGMTNCLDKLHIRPQLALVDAVKLTHDVTTHSLVKGDAHSYNIACASILAKVARDNFMIKLAKKYPSYNFAQHKGYPTREHIASLKKFGASSVHRQSFLTKILS